jgi:DNA-binding GntR family transcriptional regulator
MLRDNKKSGSGAWFTGLSQKPQSGPLYRQIKNQILAAISNKVFLPGDVFPSEVELAKIAGVTRITVRQATNELVAEGVLIRKKGKRPRAAKPKSVAHFLELAGISQYFSHGDGRYVCNVLQAEYEKATSEIARSLKIRKNSIVFVLERLRSSGDIIFGWEKTWMNRRLLAGIERHDFSRESLYRVLRNEYKIVPSHAEGVIEVLVANSAQAKLFETREGTPLLSVHRTVYTKDDQPIQVNHEIYRGDCYNFAFKAGNRK